MTDESRTATLGSYLNTSPRGATWKTFTATDAEGKIIAACDRRNQMVRRLEADGYVIVKGA